ncbi:hypothetical protein ACIGKR_12050 [Rhodococcus qingshengii]|uniref:hypothetical protein n=1 Tax=Rhodococcus qingshengii TaxID=334542 RepID=UPI0037CB418F
MPDTTDNTTATDTTAETVDTTTTEATTTETTANATDTGTTGATTEATATTTEATGLDALPESWANEIKRLRTENASDRTEAKKKAAQDATDALTKKLGEALGLIKGDEAPKPEDVIAQLTAERDTTAKKLRELTEDRALRNAATTHGGDYGSLSDSKKLSKAIAELDHTADDYPSLVDEAVKAAITADPKLKAQAATTASSIEHGGTVTAPTDDIESFRKSRREDRGHTFN